jgi:hypothetical protein
VFAIEHEGVFGERLLDDLDALVPFAPVRIEIDLEGAQRQGRVAPAHAQLDTPVGKNVLHGRARGDAERVIDVLGQEGNGMGEAQGLGQREEIAVQNLGAGGGDAADGVLLFRDAEGVEAPFLGVDDLLDELPIARLVGGAG